MSLSRRRRISVAVVDVTELADEATSALALRYHDLDFSAPRVSIAPCLRFVHALFPTTIPRVWLPRYPPNPANIYLYLQPFFRRAYKGRSDERVARL